MSLSLLGLILPSTTFWFCKPSNLVVVCFIFLIFSTKQTIFFYISVHDITSRYGIALPLTPCYFKENTLKKHHKTSWFLNEFLFLPDKLRHAEVSPIFRNNDNIHKGNYWSVSNLSLVSRLFEQIMFHIDIFIKNKLFNLFYF